MQKQKTPPVSKQEASLDEIIKSHDNLFYPSDLPRVPLLGIANCGELKKKKE